MLSFFNQQLKKPSLPQGANTRQQTLDSVFSKMSARNDAVKASSTPPSLTTASSATDRSSEPADDIALPAGPLATAFAKENDFQTAELAPRIRDSPRKTTVENGHRSFSGETIVDEHNTSEEQLLRDSMEVLNPGWELDAMPGDSLHLSRQEDPKKGAQHSTGSSFLGRMSSVVEKTKSVLGKRRRESTETDSAKHKPSVLPKRASLRIRETEASSSHTPEYKRPRIAESDTEKLEATYPSTVRRKLVKKQKKQWTSQGLYVGQDRNFDARLTESKNRMKKNLDLNEAVQKKINAIMPLPMFAGQRLLELGRQFRLPFDVHSPLPPGQPKPDEWKKTQKNVFIGDAAAVWKKARPLEHSLCLCAPESGCGENCMNRFMLYECDGSNCNIGAEHCTNRAFAELKKRQKAGGTYNIGVEVIKTADRGYGIRANRTFEPNQIIVEYTGEIITQEECDDRMRKRYKDAECYYLMDFDQSMILDATRGSIARFVNHSCDPNCRMIKWTVQGAPRMALFAGDNGIMTGEELTYDYNFNPYSMKNIQECRCGAEGCRGVLGPKPKEIKEALNPIVGAGKRKLQSLVEGAVEGVMDAVGAKRRKINVAKFVSATTAEPKKEEKERKKLKKEKPLPKGWVYPEEAQPFKRVNEIDPETILKPKKRKAKLDEEAADELAGSKKKMRMASGATVVDGSGGEYDARRRSSVKVNEDDEEGREDEAVNAGLVPAKKVGVKARVGTARKNVVRTIKKGGKSTLGKSIRVVGEE